MKRVRVLLGVVIVVSLAVGGFARTLAAAQAGAAPQQPQPPATPRAGAPMDITGYWVSVVSEDWRWRMMTPPKGDAIGIPLNPEGEKIARAWDYAQDMSAGNQCKAYGAAGIMRMPTRLHITWQDDNTLKIETDAGQQTKLFHFDKSRQPAGPRTLQGNSAAEWVDVIQAGRGGRGGGGTATDSNTPSFGKGGMKTVTANMTAGYLRKNGVPYSENAIVTEYFDRVPGPNNTQWLIVKTTVEDPKYLTQPYVTSAHFMLEPDASKWRPTPCEIDPPIMPPDPQRVIRGEVR